jgi:hypothetical protein
MASILSHQRLLRSRRLRAVAGGVLIVGAVITDLLFSTEAALPIFLLVAAVELIVVVGFVRDRLSTRRSGTER